MFQWLETHDPPGESYPYVEVGSSVSAIDSGFELSSTGGVAETFASSGFTVDATGAPPDRELRFGVEQLLPNVQLRFHFPTGPGESALYLISHRSAESADGV